MLNNPTHLEQILANCPPKLLREVSAILQPPLIAQLQRDNARDVLNAAGRLFDAEALEQSHNARCTDAMVVALRAIWQLGMGNPTSEFDRRLLEAAAELAILAVKDAKQRLEDALGGKGRFL